MSERQRPFDEGESPEHEASTLPLRREELDERVSAAAEQEAPTAVVEGDVVEVDDALQDDDSETPTVELSVVGALPENAAPDEVGGAQGPRFSRMLFVFAGVALLFAAVLVRGWQLQVADAEQTLERAGWVIETPELLQAPRGAIRDREGVPLAESVRAWNVYLDVRNFFASHRDKQAEMASLLSELPEFDAATFAAFAEQPLDELTRRWPLASNLAPARAERLISDARELGVISLYRELVYPRVYPLGPIAGSLVGFVDNQGVSGRAGLEAGLNEVLEGGEVHYRVQRDRRRDPYLFEQIPDFEAARGADVELTIDTRLQRFAEETLQRHVNRLQAQEAMAVISNVRTGEVLSLATVPSFDPNRPFDHDPEYIWVNHALGHAYEPGSTAKIFTYAAALNEGLLAWDEEIDCEGGLIEIDNEQVRDTHPEELMPAWKVLQVSSNIGALKIGMLLRDEEHERYLRDFGFGEAPQLPVTGATRGILQGAPWIDIHQANISFGHGFASSIFQVNQATATVANDGMRMEPLLVRAITRGDGRRETFGPSERGQVIRPEVARRVTEALEYVVYHEDGTGSQAAIEGVRVAGKTGTANLVDPNGGGYLREYLSSFSGYFPTADPQWAITVWVLRPNRDIAYYGGEVAAPIFSELGAEVLRLHGDGSERNAATLSEAASAAGAGQVAQVVRRVRTPSSHEAQLASLQRNEMPDLSGMSAREAAALVIEAGRNPRLHGVGRVIAQQPPPGRELDDDASIILILDDERAM